MDYPQALRHLKEQINQAHLEALINLLTAAVARDTRALLHEEDTNAAFKKIGSIQVLNTILSDLTQTPNIA